MKIFCQGKRSLLGDEGISDRCFGGVEVCDSEALLQAVRF